MSKSNISSQERRKRSTDVCLEIPDPKSSFPCEGAVRLQVVEALSSFCSLHVDMDHDKTLQKKIMHNLLTMQQDFTSYVDFRMSLTILESLIARDYGEIQRECADEPLKLLLNICQRDCKDEESLRWLLELLPDFFEYAIENDYSPKRIIHMLDQLYKRIYKQNCSILVHTSYMKCACSCVRINPDFSWSRVGVSSDDDVLMILDSILNYMGDALFVLRSQAVRCLQELLSFRNIAHKWKEHILAKVEKIVFQLFDETAQQSSSNSQKYEYYNRI